MVSNCASCGKQFGFFETKYWNPQDSESKLCAECSKRIKNKSVNNKRIGLKDKIREKAEQQKKMIPQKSGDQRSGNKRKNSSSNPLKILQIRLAKGEISKKEYQELKELIEED